MRPGSYPSHLTDALWELLAPMVDAAPGRAPGDPSAPSASVDAGLTGPNRTGCSWRQRPHDFPPCETSYWYSKTSTDDGLTDRIHDALRAAVRDAAGRDPMASAGIVDAQSVKGADTVGAPVRGHDASASPASAARDTSPPPRWACSSSCWRPPASLQDRDGGRRILDRARMAMPSIALVWADGGYARTLVTWVARYCRIVLEIVRKPEGQRTFEVLPRRWMVERTPSG